MTAAERLAALEPSCTREAALDLFDSLPSVKSVELTGRWRGRGLHTGHPMDGKLEASGWWGKQFDGVDEVHPLLFADSSGELFAVDPVRVPIGLAGRLPTSAIEGVRSSLRFSKHALRTSRHRARLRDLEHRGVVTASMVYDHLPVIDSFRRVDDETLLGVMDQRGEPLPFFFILARDGG